MKLEITKTPEEFISQINKDFLTRAKELQKATGKDHVVTLSFTNNFVTNSTLVIARAFVDYLNHHGIFCSAEDLGDSYTYAQRIGFFEDFTDNNYPYRKHPSSGRFMEIELISPGNWKARDKFTKGIREFAQRQEVSITYGALELLNYSIGELIDNVNRHSLFTGRISFQYYKESGLNEITVCDCGIGIVKALRSAGYQGDDRELLQLSVQKGITSSTSYGPYSEQSYGVGLYVLSRIAELNSGAEFKIATGKHIMTISNEYPLTNPIITNHEGFFPGTIVVLRIPDQIQTGLQEILQEMWNEDVSLL